MSGQRNQSWVCNLSTVNLNIVLTRHSSQKLLEYAEKHSALGRRSWSYAAQMRMRHVENNGKEFSSALSLTSN